MRMSGQKWTKWADANPPPLDVIFDITIQTWRKQEGAKAGTA